MFVAVLSGYFFALFTSLLTKLPKKLIGWVTSLLPLSLFVWFSSFYGRITHGEIIRETYPWIESLNINFSFLLDGLSLTFVLIITFVGFAVFLYAGTYLEENKYLTRFYVYIFIFMASMLGVVTSDNLFTLFVFWELTSISSFMLIGFKHDKEKSRYSALQALIITGGGGLALLAGFVLLGNISGTYSIYEMRTLNDIIIANPLYSAAIILILIGAFTKSAQFPFHFWLPNAMEAPTPVSAYLHSATMVKAGIYLMARLNPALGGTELWQNITLFFGAGTMLLAAFLSFQQTDLKKLLAYSTLSVLGTLTMLIGVGTDLAIKAFLIYLIAHSLYKGTLFLVAGAIDHSTGTRDILKLSGLKSFMPITAIIAFTASLSKMGIIPLVGFVGKETVYASLLEFTDYGNLFIILAIVSNLFIVYITAIVGFKPFLGKFSETPMHPHETPFQMIVGPFLLSIAGLILGIFASNIIGSLINLSETGIINNKLNIPVKLWHGFNIELFLSLLTFLLGIALYFLREKLIEIFYSFKVPNILKPSYYYDLIFNGTLLFASFQTKLLQNGYLRIYVIVIIITTVFISLFVFPEVDLAFGKLSISFIPQFWEILIALIIITASYFVIRAKTRLSAIIYLGVVGFSIALIFIMYSAPDLAMTQFLVETLTVVLLMLVIYKLPKYLPSSSMLTRIRDFSVAAAGGLLMSFITLFVISGNLNSELKSYFAENSLTIGKGRNIVNVILVDFRALDTLGEITVLAVAAIGVFGLLKLRKENKS